MHVYIRTQDGKKIVELNKVIDKIESNNKKYWITTGRGGEQIVLGVYDDEEMSDKVLEYICETIKKNKEGNIYIDLR